MVKTRKLDYGTINSKYKSPKKTVKYPYGTRSKKSLTRKPSKKSLTRKPSKKSLTRKPSKKSPRKSKESRTPRISEKKLRDLKRSRKYQPFDLIIMVNSHGLKDDIPNVTSKPIPHNLNVSLMTSSVYGLSSSAIPSTHNYGKDILHQKINEFTLVNNESKYVFDSLLDYIKKEPNIGDERGDNDWNVYYNMEQYTESYYQGGFGGIYALYLGYPEKLYSEYRKNNNMIELKKPILNSFYRYTRLSDIFKYIDDINKDIDKYNKHNPELEPLPLLKNIGIVEFSCHSTREDPRLSYRQRKHVDIKQNKKGIQTSPYRNEANARAVKTESLEKDIKYTQRQYINYIDIELNTDLTQYYLYDRINNKLYDDSTLIEIGTLYMNLDIDNPRQYFEPNENYNNPLSQYVLYIKGLRGLNKINVYVDEISGYIYIKLHAKTNFSQDELPYMEHIGVASLGTLYDSYRLNKDSYKLISSTLFNNDTLLGKHDLLNLKQKSIIVYINYDTGDIYYKDKDNLTLLGRYDGDTTSYTLDIEHIINRTTEFDTMSNLEEDEDEDDDDILKVTHQDGHDDSNHQGPPDASYLDTFFSFNEGNRVSSEHVSGYNFNGLVSDNDDNFNGLLDISNNDLFRNDP